MAWKAYEEVARDLLHQFREDFGLAAVEGKQTLDGELTSWEIDAKGVRESDGATIVVECRRYTTSRENQKGAAALAYTISDTGAVGGIHVSPLGLQEGAERIAAGENIVEVHLNQDATTEEFQMKFFDKLKLGAHDKVELRMTETLRATIIDKHGNVISDDDVDLQGQ